MTFLVDEDLPRSVALILKEFRHEVVDVRDVGLRGASDRVIADYARAHGCCLVTADGGFGNLREYPPAEYGGLVVLDLPPGATSVVIQNLLRSFLEHADIVSAMPGRLAIVDFGRIRLR